MLEVNHACRGAAGWRPYVVAVDPQMVAIGCLTTEMKVSVTVQTMTAILCALYALEWEVHRVLGVIGKLLILRYNI